MGKTQAKRGDALRIWRSPYSDFYKDETLHAAKVYTQDYLQELAGAGFNAIWIHAYLRDVAPTKVFPELGRNSAAHLRSLRTVMRRAERTGIRLFLYMQPPMGMPARAAFWRKHPEARGVTKRDSGASAMCTSEPKVRAFLREAAETLSRRLPGLGGAILITASEYLAHCYSQYPIQHDITYWPKPTKPLGCPRCARRHPREIVADVVNSIHGGFHAAGNNAQVIAWNWSWSMYEQDPQKQIVDMLPRDVTLMAGFERGGWKTILGKTRVIDEYALSYAGPSERFVASVKTARRRGLKTMAKLQIGVTHELGTVPNLPLIGSLYEKARAMRRMKVASYVGCWNFGNMLTANTAAFNHFLGAKRLLPRPQALAGFARDYLPGCDAQGVAAAWHTFREAMDHYPFCIPFLYEAPLTYAVAHPIEPGPIRPAGVGPAWRLVPRGDELQGTFGPYTLGEIIQGLRALSRLWWQGVEAFENAVAGCDTPAALQELNSARMAGHCFQSGRNLYRAYRLRRKWSDSRLEPLRAVMRDECEHLPGALRIAEADRRMGFHSGCQRYLFTPSGIRGKLRRLKELLSA